MKNIFFKNIGLILITFILASWGGQGHYKINYCSSLSFNSEMSEFYTWATILANHASDADYRKQTDPTESPKHYIDIDNYNEFQNGSIPQNLADAISMYGISNVYDWGILPWATKTAFDSLKNCFIRKDWTKAELFASDLGHYVADGHMPLHITANYNGQNTGNLGIHSRYESTMVNNYISQINYQGLEIFEIQNVEQFIFDYIYSNYTYIDSVLLADNYAKTINSNTSSSQYTQALWSKTQYFTNFLFKQASNSLAKLIYTAWKQAGSPSMVNYIDNQNYKSKTILNQNFPNPFSNSTKILFSVNQNSNIKLIVNDLNGKIVSTLLNEVLMEGDYNIDFNAGNLKSGTYFVVLISENSVQTKKIMIL